MDDSGDDGFVIFTLGSMVSDMPAEKAKEFFDAFGQIPQRVIDISLRKKLLITLERHLFSSNKTHNTNDSD